MSDNPRFPLHSLKLPPVNMPGRVLIADDNEMIRTMVRSHIGQLAGLEVCAAVANGMEAVEAAISLHPDVLILDVLMPKLNGIQAAHAIKKSLPAVKIVFFTVISDAVRPEILSDLGARLVSKIDGDGVLPALGRAVQELLGTRSREVDEGLARAISDRAIDAHSLDLLTRQFSAPLTRCGRDLKYLWVNEYYANFVQRPLDKIVGRSILDVVGKTAFQVLQAYFDQVLRGGDVSYKAEVEYQFAGRRHVAASYKPTFDACGSPDGWLAYIQDVTALPQ